MKIPFLPALLVGFFLLISQSIFAQDRGISYQAVARDGSDAVQANVNLKVRFTLLQGATSIYQEEQTVTTNKFGLFTAVIGSEDFTTFKALDWSPATSLKVEIDPGTGFIDMGTSNLESVPYANSALKVTDMKIGGLTDVSDAAPAVDQVLKWDGTQWAPAASASGSEWSKTGNNIYYDQGRVGVGTNNPGSFLHVVGDGSSGRSIEFETTTINSGNDLVELKVPTGATDNAQFMEFQKGATIVAAINTDGSAEFKSVEFEDGSVQTSAAKGPLAFGFIESAGTTASSSGNFTSTWNASSNRYEITITGESYFWKNYATVITPTSSTITKFRTGSVSGKLLVYLYNSSGASIQENFQFITYKP